MRLQVSFFLLLFYLLTSILIFVESLEEQFLGKGIASSAGAARGQIAFTNEEAMKMKLQGVDCILCREETSAEDIAGMQVMLLLLLLLMKRTRSS